jgi:Flp pilus assembly protein TadG
MMTMRARGKVRKRWGGAVVEMAVVAPIFVCFILGQLESSRLGMVAQLLTTGAREGCRVAVINGSLATDVQTRLNLYLTNAGIPLQTLTAVNTDPGTAGAWIMPSTWATGPGNTTPISIIIRIPYSQVSWLPAPLFLAQANVVGAATLNSERP